MVDTTATIDMARTYEVAKIITDYGAEYFAPCLILNGRATSCHGKSHLYERTARKALKKWASDLEQELQVAIIEELDERTNGSNLAMWEFVFPRVMKSTAGTYMSAVRRRCYWDDRAQIILPAEGEPCSLLK